MCGQLMRTLVIAAFVLAGTDVRAQTTPNPGFDYGAVIEAFQQRNPQMVHFSLLYRGEASENLDIIVVRGGRPDNARRPRSRIDYFIEGDLLGLFLVERSNPARAYTITIDGEINDGYEATVTLERAVPGELTILLLSNYGMPTSRRKYSYDAPAKRLLWKRDFSAHGLDQLKHHDESFLISGTIYPLGRGRQVPTVLSVTPVGSSFLTMESPSGAAPSSASKQQLLTFGPDQACALMEHTKDFLLRTIDCSTSNGNEHFEAPKSTYHQYVESRPQVLTNGTKSEASREETIGPYSVEANDIWFGLTFYDGEGNSGVGGYGRFDSVSHRFEMYYPPEIADWSVSALFVEPGAIWLALARRSEGAQYTGGLLRWDRNSHETQHLPEAPLIRGIARQGKQLYLATSEGLAIFEDGEFVRYVLDVNRDGEYGLAKRELR